MKYTSTSRTLSLMAHALIFAAFGVMGLWFGFFVVPQYLGGDANHWYRDSGLAFDSNGPFFLWLELAVVGLVFMIISAVGFVYALKSLKDVHDDEPAVKSFIALICEGWIAAIFFLLQAALLWDLTANGNIPFIIIMALIIAIILLIATNIPMVKIFDQRDQKPLLRAFLGSAALTLLVLAIETALGLIGASTWANQKVQVLHLLITIISFSFGGAILAFFAWFAMRKNAGEKGTSVATYLAAASILVVGAGLMTYGIMDICYQYAPGSSTVALKAHLYMTDLSFDLGFGIMAIVLGSLCLIGSLVVAYFANHDLPKAAKKIEY